MTETTQWQRCDSDGSGCAPIAGASGDTYELTPADVGHDVRFVVSATNPGGTTTVASKDVGPDRPRPSPPAQSRPSIALAGGLLTTTTGQFAGDGPFTYAYQWQRCDAGGTNCSDIPGATAATYRYGAGDAGQAFVVKVTATNVSGSATAVSAPLALRGAPDHRQAAHDDAALDDAALDHRSQRPPGQPRLPAVCQELTNGVGYHRLNLRGAGAVRLRVRADGVVVPEAPLIAEVSADSVAKIRSVRFYLDGRVVRATGAGPWTVSLSPKSLATASRHKLTVVIQPVVGGSHRVTEPMRSVPCAARFSAGEWRTKAGTGLRLRVDSRSALRRVAFPLPAALVSPRALAPRAGLGRLRVVVRAGSAACCRWAGRARAATAACCWAARASRPCGSRVACSR